MGVCGRCLGGGACGRPAQAVDTVLLVRRVIRDSLHQCVCLSSVLVGLVQKEVAAPWTAATQVFFSASFGNTWRRGASTRCCCRRRGPAAAARRVESARRGVVAAEALLGRTSAYASLIQAWRLLPCICMGGAKRAKLFGGRVFGWIAGFVDHKCRGALSRQRGGRLDRAAPSSSRHRCPDRTP